MNCPACGRRVEDADGMCSHCGQEIVRPSGEPSGVDSPPTDRDALPSGHVLGGRFEIRSVVGAGRLAVVHRAFDRDIEVDVAVKVFRKNVLPKEADRSRFLTACAAARRLSHPNLVRIFHAEIEGDYPFVAMQLLEGLTLRQILDLRKEKGHPFSVEELEPVVSQVAAALEFGHQLGPHGALHPDNVLVLPDLLKVTDFHLAGALPPAVFLEAQLRGVSEPYLAPEVRAGKPLTAAADVFSLAMLAAELLTGDLPRTFPYRLEAQRSGLSEKLGASLADCLDEDPTHRPPSAAILARAVLDVAVENSGVSASRVLSASRISRIGTGTRAPSRGAIGSVVEAASGPDRPLFGPERHPPTGDADAPGPVVATEPPPYAAEATPHPAGPPSSPLPPARGRPPPPPPPPVARRDSDAASPAPAAAVASVAASVAAAAAQAPSPPPPPEPPVDATVASPPGQFVPAPGEGGMRPTPPPRVMPTAVTRHRQVPLLVWVLLILLLVGGGTYGAIQYIDYLRAEEASALLEQRKRDRQAALAKRRRFEQERADLRARIERSRRLEALAAQATLQRDGSAPESVDGGTATAGKTAEPDSTAKDPSSTSRSTTVAATTRTRRRKAARSRSTSSAGTTGRARRVAGTGSQVEVTVPGAVTTGTTPPSDGGTTGSSGAVTAATTPPPPKTKRCPQGMAHIKAGAFRMGSAKTDPMRNFGERSLVWVKTAEYCIDRYEYPNSRGAMPMSGVSWSGASKLCERKGKRLCTEKEWERACKGSSRRFPYGDKFDPARCNTETAAGKKRSVTRSGAFSGCRSPYGVYDLSGNVAEWTATKLSSRSSARIVKGGSSNKPDWAVRCANRGNKTAGSRSGYLGFRCCAEPE